MKSGKHPTKLWKIPQIYLTDFNATSGVSIRKHAFETHRSFFFPSSLLLPPGPEGLPIAPPASRTQWQVMKLHALSWPACTLVCKELLEFRKSKQKNVQNFNSMKFGFKDCFLAIYWGEKKCHLWDSRLNLSVSFHVALSFSRTKALWLNFTTQRVPWRKKLASEEIMNPQEVFWSLFYLFPLRYLLLSFFC